MSSFRSFDGGSVLKCSAQIASNWALFKVGRASIRSESVSCTLSPLWPKNQPYGQ